MGKVGRKRSMMSSVLRTLASLMLLLGPVLAQDVVVGVNVINPMRASVADQNAVLSQLEAAHVHVIRCGISNDDKGIDYAKRGSEAYPDPARDRRPISGDCSDSALSA
jgi:hypothetical protein